MRGTVAAIGDRQLRARQRRQHAAQADRLIDPRQRAAAGRRRCRNVSTASSTTPPCALAGSTSIACSVVAALAQRAILRRRGQVAACRSRAYRSISSGPAAPRRVPPAPCVRSPSPPAHRAAGRDCAAVRANRGARRRLRSAADWPRPARARSAPRASTSVVVLPPPGGPISAARHCARIGGAHTWMRRASIAYRRALQLLAADAGRQLADDLQRQRRDPVPGWPDPPAPAP